MEKISWNEPKFGKKELALVKQVLDSGYVTEGPMTQELEKKLAKIVKAKHVIMTPSCTSALYLAIESDKRIRNYIWGKALIPDLTFIATKNAVELANLIPQIIDVDANNFCLPSGGYDKDTRIIVNVNLLGRNNKLEVPRDMTLICDNAGCLGSNVSNGKVGCYSLQANKLITCGMGGFCATDDDNYAKVIRQIKDFGRIAKEQQDTVGFNFKFNDIQSAVVLGQLADLENRKKKLKGQYSLYKKELTNYGRFLKYNPTEVPLWIGFITQKRDNLYDYLKSKNIQCRKPWYPLIGLKFSSFYSDYCIWLPSGPTLDRRKQNYVIKCIKECFHNDVFD